jgi:hypothetical protein
VIARRDPKLRQAGDDNCRTSPDLPWRKRAVGKSHMGQLAHL